MPRLISLRWIYVSPGKEIESTFSTAHSPRNINPLQPLRYFRFCLYDSMIVCLNKWQVMWLLLGRPACCQAPDYLNVFHCLRVITNPFAHTYKYVTQHCDSCLCLDLFLVSNLPLGNPEYTAAKSWMIFMSILLGHCLTFLCKWRIQKHIPWGKFRNALHFLVEIWWWTYSLYFLTLSDGCKKICFLDSV